MVGCTKAELPELTSWFVPSLSGILNGSCRFLLLEGRHNLFQAKKTKKPPKNLRLVRGLIVPVSDRCINSSIKALYLNSFVVMYLLLILMVHLALSLCLVTFLCVHWGSCQMFNQSVKCLRCNNSHSGVSTIVRQIYFPYRISKDRYAAGI